MVLVAENGHHHSLVMVVWTLLLTLSGLQLLRELPARAQASI